MKYLPCRVCSRYRRDFWMEKILSRSLKVTKPWFLNIQWTIKPNSFLQILVFSIILDYHTVILHSINLNLRIIGDPLRRAFTATCRHQPVTEQRDWMSPAHRRHNVSHASCQRATLASKSDWLIAIILCERDPAEMLLSCWQDPASVSRMNSEPRPNRLEQWVRTLKSFVGSRTSLLF